MQRRTFLKLGTAAAVGMASSQASSNAESARNPHIQRYVRLGNTELTVSDISFGSSRLSDAKLVRYAYDKGVTYFDTAESYRGGASESAVGAALSGVRDEVVIASKTKARAGQSSKKMMIALENSLKRLRTDYVDIYYNHAVNDPDRMKNPEWAIFTERAIEQGKIRYRGMSGHGSRLVECLDYALDNDLVDVTLVAFNFSQDPTFEEELRYLFHYVALQPELIRVVKKARAKGTGVVAMKTLMGARLHDMRPYERDGATFAQAALRWVLAGGLIDSAAISMTGFAEIDEFISASGYRKVAEGDFNLLARYTSLQANRYCQHGCGICIDSCPNNLQIPEILRVRMYDADYGDRALAVAGYQALDQQAIACVECADQPCIGACPNSIPIAAYTQDAAKRFEIA